jgi:ribonuclease-3
LQARRLPVPEYRVVGVSGEAHAQTFTAECSVPALGVATRGSGSSRRVAEQAAASAAYDAVTRANARPQSP